MPICKHRQIFRSNLRTFFCVQLQAKRSDNLNRVSKANVDIFNYIFQLFRIPIFFFSFVLLQCICIIIIAHSVDTTIYSRGVKKWNPYAISFRSLSPVDKMCGFSRMCSAHTHLASNSSVHGYICVFVHDFYLDRIMQSERVHLVTSSINLEWVTFPTDSVTLNKYQKIINIGVWGVNGACICV